MSVVTKASGNLLKTIKCLLGTQTLKGGKWSNEVFNKTFLRGYTRGSAISFCWSTEESLRKFVLTATLNCPKLNSRAKRNLIAHNTHKK